MLIGADVPGRRAVYAELVEGDRFAFLYPHHGEARARWVGVKAAIGHVAEGDSDERTPSAASTSMDVLIDDRPG